MNPFTVNRVTWLTLLALLLPTSASMVVIAPCDAYAKDCVNCQAERTFNDYKDVEDLGEEVADAVDGFGDKYDLRQPALGKLKKAVLKRNTVCGQPSRKKKRRRKKRRRKHHRVAQASVSIEYSMSAAGVQNGCRLDMHGGGWCARDNRLSYEDAGLVAREAIRDGAAVNLHRKGILKKQGWIDVMPLGFTPETAPQGAMIVYSGGTDPLRCREYGPRDGCGHVETHIGDLYCSDFCSYRPINQYLPRKPVGIWVKASEIQGSMANLENSIAIPLGSSRAAAPGCKSCDELTGLRAEIERVPAKPLSEKPNAADLANDKKSAELFKKSGVLIGKQFAAGKPAPETVAAAARFLALTDDRDGPHGALEWLAETAGAKSEGAFDAIEAALPALVKSKAITQAQSDSLVDSMASVERSGADDGDDEE